MKLFLFLVIPFMLFVFLHPAEGQEKKGTVDSQNPSLEAKEKGQTVEPTEKIGKNEGKNEPPPNGTKQKNDATSSEMPKAPAPPTLEEQIARLKPHVDSIPDLWKLLENNTNLQATESALKFLSRFDDVAAPSVIMALLSLAYHPDEATRNLCRAHIFKSGPVFFTVLRRLLKTENLAEKKKIAALLAQRGVPEIPTFVELMQTAGQEEQKIAIECLAQIGPVVIPHIANLIESTDDKKFYENALQVWLKIGESNLGVLVLSLKDAKPKNQQLLIQAIARIGEIDIMPIIEVLRLNPNNRQRSAIEEAFYQMGPSVVPKLLPFYYDPITDVRKTIAGTIKRLEKQAVDSLVKILQDASSPEQKKNALNALADIGKDSLEAIDIIKPLAAEPGELQYGAVYAIQKMGNAGAKQSIAELIKAFDSSKDWMVKTAAASALANAGPDATPALNSLKKALKTERYGEVRTSICRAIGKMGNKGKDAVPQLIQALEDLDETVVQSAAEALGNIGPAASSAIPNLIQVLSSYGAAERECAAKALAKIGAPAIAKLTYLLRFSEDPGAREGSAIALKYMGPKASPAAQALMVALRTDIPVIKKQAVLALGEIGPVSSSAIQSLIEASRDSSEIVRDAAAEALPKMGVNVIPSILQTLKRYDEQEEVRVTLVRAIGNFGPQAAPTLGTLIGYFQRWQGASQKELIKTFSKLGDVAKETIPLLVDLLKTSDDPETHMLISKTMVHFGKDSIPALLPLLKEDKKQVKKSVMGILDQMNSAAMPYLFDIVEHGKDDLLAAEAIKIIGKKLDHIQYLVGLLKKVSPVVQNAAVETLIRIGIPGIPKLLEFIAQSESEKECKLARKILSSIGESSVPHLVGALKDVNGNGKLARKTLIETIGEIGPKAQMAITPLVDLMIHWKGEDRLMLAFCFGKIGPTTIQYLVKLLQHDDSEVQEAAVIALGETKSPEVVEHLLISLKDPRLLSRVINASVKMKGLAVPILIKSLGDKNQHIRFACAASLKEIADQKALEELKRQYLVETDPMVKYMIEIAISASQK